jgi:hypothetical protein
MDPGTVELQHEGLRENSEQTVEHLLLKMPQRKAARKGRSENAQTKRYGGQAHPRPSSQYCR